MPSIRLKEEITDTIRNALGEEGAARIERFMETREGWDYGRGRRFSMMSLAVLDFFLQHKPKLPRQVFEYMTANGNIQLEWVDDRGEEYEVEFFPDRFEYYFTATEEEGACDLSEVNLLIQKIERIAGDHASTR